MPTSPRPSQRPSFAQRDSYRSAVSNAYAEGRLGDKEFAERSTKVESAPLLSDLEKLVSDIPRGDIPVPVKPSRRTRSSRRGKRRGLADLPRRKVTGLVTVAVLVGAGLGVAGFHRPSAAYETQRVEPRADTSAVDGFLSYGYVKGVLDKLGDKRVTEINLSYRGAEAQIVQRNGKHTSTLSFDKDLKQSTIEGNNKDLRADDADVVTLSATDLDPAVVHAMVLKAPKLMAEDLDDTDSDDLRTNRLTVQRHAGDTPVGMKKNAVTVQADVDIRDSEASVGRVEWSSDGKTLLEVKEL